MASLNPPNDGHNYRNTIMLAPSEYPYYTNSTVEVSSNREKKMTKYVMREDSGASEIIEAESIEEALQEALEWASDGSYQERVIVSVRVIELDANGEQTDNQLSGDVEAGPEPKAPNCADGQEHDWQSPHEIVGGIKDNPGVWSAGGTRTTYRDVCAHCGQYRVTRRTGSQRNPGELPETVTYEDADERSLKWVSEQINLDDIPEVTEEQFAAGIVRHGLTK